eukprot:6610077-Prymnesium_polylepis.2
MSKLQPADLRSRQGRGGPPGGAPWGGGGGATEGEGHLVRCDETTNNRKVGSTVASRQPSR